MSISTTAIANVIFASLTAAIDGSSMDNVVVPDEYDGSMQYYAMATAIFEAQVNDPNGELDFGQQDFDASFDELLEKGGAAKDLADCMLTYYGADFQPYYDKFIEVVAFGY